MEQVSIIITAYLEKSKPYLDACIQSIKNLNYDNSKIEVIIVTPTWYIPEYEGCRTIHPCFGAYHNPVAVNYGFDQANKDSKYLMLLNDDVIMTRNSLRNMVMAVGAADVILSPISNCDNYGHYTLNFPFDLKDRQYRIEQIRDLLPDMMNADSCYPRGFIFPHTLYLYANLFPRKVWETVTGGTTQTSIGFDENFKTGFDDTDYCMRAQHRGVKLAICLDALIWHMSGASADTTMGDLKSDIRAQNENYFKQKWAIA